MIIIEYSVAVMHGRIIDVKYFVYNDMPWKYLFFLCSSYFKMIYDEERYDIQVVTDSGEVEMILEEFFQNIEYKEMKILIKDSLIFIKEFCFINVINS